MVYKYITTPQGKSLVKVRHTHKDKSTIAERFKDKAGKTYAKMIDGSVRLINPLKPWKGKSERRQVIKYRRELLSKMALAT